MRRLSFCKILKGAAALSLLFSFGCKQQSAEEAPGTPYVSVVRAKAENNPVSFEYVAQTESSHLVNIQARVSGFLDTQVYTEGSFVKEGEVLFIMDKKPFEAQAAAQEAALERQRAAHETARLNLNRVRPLAEQNALSQKDLDDATGQYETTAAAVEQAKAQLATALLNLSYCTIHSPIDGITGAARQQEGAYLNVADSQLTTVSALDPIWVNFSLSEKEIQRYRDQVKAGSLLPPKDEEYTVQVIQIDGTPFPYTGKITFTAPYFNPETGTFLLRATVPNPDSTLRPNQYVRARIEGAKRPNSILLPQKAVRQSSKGHYVWLVDENSTLRYQPVTVGDWQGRSWFIAGGLKNGDRVVVDGGPKLQAGEKVAIKTVQK